MVRVRKPTLLSFSPQLLEDLKKEKIRTGIPASRLLENAFYERKLRRRGYL